MEKGYVKLWRAIDDNELLANNNNCYVVFNKLLTHADRKTGSYRTGRYKFAAICNLPPSTLRDTLNRLQTTTMIRQQTDRRSTTIFICNWWKYQQDADSNPSITRRKSDTKQEIEREYINTKVFIYEKDVASAFKYWNELTGKSMRSEKSNTAAVRRLIKQYGIDKVIRSIQGAVYYQTKEFRPKIFSFNTLEKKWDELDGWMESDIKSKKSNGVDIK